MTSDRRGYLLPDCDALKGGVHLDQCSLSAQFWLFWPHREQARSHRGMRLNVGASLLAIGATRYQHSTALTANPPRDVSLYLSCISAPVSRMVRITRSSEMKC
jgi:hypothetical protein